MRLDLTLSKRAQNEINHGKLLARMQNAEAAWGWGTPAGRERAEKRISLIVRGAEIEAGRRVLEIGCGTGMFTEMLARSGAKIVAVDISPDLLEKARARNLPPDQIQFLHQSFEDTSLTGPFDAVVGSSVLHHLDLATALRKIMEVLKPGGWLSFAEPNMLNPQIFLERKLWFIRPLFWYVSRDETAFVRWSLHARLKEAGFENIEVTPFDWLHPLTPSKLVGQTIEMGERLERIPLLREFSGSLFIRARRPV